MGDLSPSSNAEFYFVNSQSTIYKYKTNNESKHNYRIGYGFDITSINGWLLCDISRIDKLEFSKFITAFEASLKTSSGRIHGPALKLCFFIFTYYVSVAVS